MRGGDLSIYVGRTRAGPYNANVIRLAEEPNQGFSEQAIFCQKENMGDLRHLCWPFRLGPCVQSSAA